MGKTNSVLGISGLLALAAVLPAQQAPLTIEQAVDRALARYPAVRASQEDVSSAAAAIQLARTSYLPRLDAIGQLNRATRNNVWGMVLPQTVLPSMTGPVNYSNNYTSVWGSAVGVAVTWEPFDFGVRKANVEAAEFGRKRAEAAVTRTRFEVAAQAADAFLTILAAQQTVVAAQAGVQRARVFSDAVSALVKAELRPGADLSRSQAELALAKTQFAQAKQAVGIARANLSQLIDLPPGEIELAAGSLSQPAPGAAPEAAGLDTHPLLMEQDAAISEVKARERILDHAYYPKFAVQGTEYARGTGANPDGTTGGGAAGLGPNISNWGVGMTVVFPILELSSIKAKREIEAGHRRAETARFDQIRQDLTGRLEAAKATLEGAREIAENTPVQVKAAKESESQASARYRAGLATIDQVAESQRLLTQAEIDDALAELNVWRAHLAVAAAQGDLAPFLQQAK